jgi:antirestriction protein ArdC
MTNAEIIKGYKIMMGLTEEIHTYTKWKAMGYQVKKGEKSQHEIAIWKHTTKKVIDKSGEEIDRRKMVVKTAHFFTESQVEKIQ